MSSSPRWPSSGGTSSGRSRSRGRSPGRRDHASAAEGRADPTEHRQSAWAGAGPGWGLLALTGDLAKGVVPVGVGIVTWSWGIGWVAGLGALLGARWPAFGRLPGGPGVAVLGGVVFTLAPPAGVMSVLLAGARPAGRDGLLGRDSLVPAIATGFGAFAVPVPRASSRTSCAWAPSSSCTSSRASGRARPTIADFATTGTPRGRVAGATLRPWDVHRCSWVTGTPPSGEGRRRSARRHELARAERRRRRPAGPDRRPTRLRRPAVRHAPPRARPDRGPRGSARRTGTGA